MGIVFLLPDFAHKRLMPKVYFHAEKFAVATCRNFFQIYQQLGFGGALDNIINYLV